MPIEICSPPLVGLLMLMVICSGLALAPLAVLVGLRLRIISGPLAGTGLGPVVGGSTCLCPPVKALESVEKACRAPAPPSAKHRCLF
jgi:hypothetical protein